MTAEGTAATSHARRAVFLVLPRVHLLDLAGPAQVLTTAADQGVAYRLEYCSVRWLRSAVRVGASVASICSGAALLAQAGLLDGRRCTTHWRLTAQLARRSPHARVVDDALFVHDGPVTTSAGIASGIDMTLGLLERRHGPLLTARVARDLVVSLRRDGAQDQRSVYLEYRTHLHPGVHRVQDELSHEPTRRRTLRDLANVANMSERSLTRAFKAHTGLTPLQYQHKLRLELARPLLHDPHLSVQAVAHRCDFDNVGHFRRLWMAEHGTLPGGERRRATPPR